MIDHVSLRVSDIQKSKAFYSTLLGSIGYKAVLDFDDGAGYAPKDSSDVGSIWIIKEEELTKNCHVAFRLESKEAVQSFYSVGLEAGRRDNGKPGFRPEYDEGYYGGFILDPDGNNIEAVYYEQS